jgi:hypothetical protein
MNAVVFALDPQSWQICACPIRAMPFLHAVLRIGHGTIEPTDLNTADESGCGNSSG